MAYKSKLPLTAVSRYGILLTTVITRKGQDRMNTDKKNWFARHKVLSVVIGLVVLIAISSAASAGNKSNTSDTASNKTTNSDQPSSGQKQEVKATTAKVGQPARDGKFEFTVNTIRCGETTIGNQYLNKTAQGQFCRLNLTVKNIADVAQSLDGSSQCLFNATGQKYAADTTATFYTEPSNASTTWYNSVNPGNAVTGDIIFDIPKDQVPATAELHDSAFSGGVRVNLR